jgi:hypothetical protein
MPISYQYKTIFLHIPKCGGTSIEKVLGTATIEELFSFKRANKHRDISISPKKFSPDDFSLCMSKTPQHFTFMELKKSIPAEIFDSYLKFSVIRNPYTRFVSEYNHIKGKIKLVNTFDDLVRCLQMSKKDRISIFDGHLETQTSFLVNEENKIDSSVKIFRFENIQECFDLLHQLTPIKVVPHARKNKEDHPWQSHFTEDTRLIISKFYAEDFINFGYDTNFK